MTLGRTLVLLPYGVPARQSHREACSEILISCGGDVDRWIDQPADDLDGRARTPDELIVEEPMTVQLDGVTVSTTMRTPGHDYELAVGFCFTDGLLAGAPVTGVRYCANGSAVGRLGSTRILSSAPPPASVSPASVRSRRSAFSVWYCSSVSPSAVARRQSAR